MEIEYLRIGNYIYEPVNGQNDDTKPFKVWGIYHEQGNNKINNFPASYFEPIPLTEEWLLKFGFEKRVNFEYSDGSKSDTNIFITDSFMVNNYDEKYWSLCKMKYFNQVESVLQTELKYVHQLQNLFFALTGKELTIKE